MDGFNYTWIPATDQGIRIFINVNFTQTGMQTIVAMDTLDGSINGLASINVVGADVKMETRKKLSVAASGDTVQFQVCWSNYSSATAYSFVITGAVPRGTVYVPEVASLALCGWNGPMEPTITMAYSTSTSTMPPALFTSLLPISTAPTNTRWLRWTIKDAYVHSSGCMCFKVVVD